MPGPSWIEATTPLWIVRLPRDYEPHEFAAQFDELTSRLRAEKGKVAIVIDVTMLRKSNSGNRERASEFFRSEKAMLKSKVVGWAFVTTNTAIRGAIATIGFLGVFPIPTRTFETVHGARGWLSGMLPGVAAKATTAP